MLTKAYKPGTVRYVRYMSYQFRGLKLHCACGETEQEAIDNLQTYIDLWHTFHTNSEPPMADIRMSPVYAIPKDMPVYEASARFIKKNPYAK